MLLSGCGSGQGSVAVTPVMVDARGSYRLVESQTGLTPPGGTTAFSSYSSGTLRLSATTYLRLVEQHGTQSSRGYYALGSSVNTVLTSRNGRFTLTMTDSPVNITGNYLVAPDYLLTLIYDPVTLFDGTLLSRSETWYKESDNPHTEEQLVH